jgi:hypothetical protein
MVGETSPMMREIHTRLQEIRLEPAVGWYFVVSFPVGSPLLPKKGAALGDLGKTHPGRHGWSRRWIVEPAKDGSEWKTLLAMYEPLKDERVAAAGVSLPSPRPQAEAAGTGPGLPVPAAPPHPDALKGAQPMAGMGWAGDFVDDGAAHTASPVTNDQGGWGRA